MDRVFNIINLLLDNKEPITINDIANKLKVSNKTIRNDMEKVEELIIKKGLMLTKKQGVGICIEGTEINRLELQKECLKGKKIIEPYSPEDRRYYILKRLFMSDENITIKELAEELFVSRVTIHKDIDEVETWLKNYNLKLLKKTNYGIEIIGREEDWRNAVVGLISVNKENEELRELLYDDYSGRIDYRTMVKLKELINLDYKQLERILVEAEEKLNFNFSDDAFISLIIHIAISIKRLKSNKDITLSSEVMEGLKKKSEYIIAEDIASDIENTFKVKQGECETGYILLHILGAKMQQSKAIDETMNLENDDLSVSIAYDIITMAQQTININLSTDKQLLNGLILHLRPTINRLKYDLTLRNPILKEIKETYPELYGLAWMTSGIFEKYLGIRISEEEIGYIALHLGAAIERQKKPFSALVVCTSGIGTAQLLAAKLEKRFKEIEIKDIISLTALKEVEYKDIDLIISTVAIESDKPVINISPLLTQNDIKRLDLLINSLKNKSRSKAEDMLNFINDELVEIKACYRTKAEVITSICNKFYSKGYVDQNFIEDVFKRESLGPTEVGNGVAIPHGFSEHVIQSEIGIVILDNPIEWAGGMVDVIFLIGISKADLSKAKGIFKKLYNKIDSVMFLENIRKANSAAEIKRLLEVK